MQIDLCKMYCFMYFFVSKYLFSNIIKLTLWLEGSKII